MKSKNPYAYLKTDCLEDVSPVEAQSVWLITEDSRESITILSAPLPDGAWVFGYIVNWANGRTSSQAPVASLGRFRSQREAKLYAIGFMIAYFDYFQDPTRTAIRIAEASLLQAELF